MTGPTVGILLEDKLSDTAKEEVLAFIHSVSDEVRGRDFWVNDSPFGYEFGPDYPEELDEYAELNLLTEWKPKDIIGLYSMCNSKRDHRVLGEVTLSIVKIVRGKVAFNSLLNNYTSDPVILNDPSTIEFKNESIINPENFERWLQHKDFRMVK